ncbi:hypothetical protein KAR91_30355 [Candidatus Pacearchaeota archaeon]|nr:hypothetical protein [Candidatus Pacearchaeota archaeon]
MPARSHLRGHPIFYSKDGKFYYADDDTPTENSKDRPCGNCGKYATEEGHDSCLKELPGVSNLCCGHGNPKEAYIVFTNGVRIEGFTVSRRADNG